jgi:hypothetical protein
VCQRPVTAVTGVLAIDLTDGPAVESPATHFRTLLGYPFVCENAGPSQTKFGQDERCNEDAPFHPDMDNHSPRAILGSIDGWYRGKNTVGQEDGCNCVTSRHPLAV